VIGGAVIVAVYAALAVALRMQEVTDVLGMLRRRLRPR
jgi:hypothetical protein